MSRSAREVRVNVHLDSVRPLQFRVEPEDEDLKGPEGQIQFTNNCHPGFLVKFVLQRATDGYLFPRNAQAKEAIWSEVGDGKCPQSSKRDVFKAPRVSPDGKILTVTNPNPKPAQGKFGYTLRVTNDGGESFLDLDPGGINNNGNYR